MTDKQVRFDAPHGAGKYETFGYALAAHVMQSDLYFNLDDKERAECDELIRRGLEAPLSEIGERKDQRASAAEQHAQFGDGDYGLTGSSQSEAHPSHPPASATPSDYELMERAIGKLMRNEGMTGEALALLNAASLTIRRLERELAEAKAEVIDWRMHTEAAESALAALRIALEQARTGHADEAAAKWIQPPPKMETCGHCKRQVAIDAALKESP